MIEVLPLCNYGNNVNYLTPQNMFLEDLRFLKFEIFLPASNHGVCKEKWSFQKMVSQKNSGYGPDL